MGVSPTDPGEPGLILKLDQLFRGLPAALTGVGPPAAAALQPAPQLVALGHVVPEEQVIAGDVPAAVVELQHQEVAGGAPQLVT